MLLLAHTGITLGAAVLVAGALSSSRSAGTSRSKATEPPRRSSQAVPDSDCTRSERASWLTWLGSRIDVRILLLGSLLPDIVDKPLGIFLFPETFNSGRIFCHTLLFLILITLAGVYVYRRYRKTWLLVLSFGTFTHLVLDQMWLTPRTLFWPLYGSTFEPADITNWIQDMLYALMTNPRVYVPELLGVGILIWFVVALLRRREILAFIRYGQVA